jgi:hypothetical protein
MKHIARMSLICLTFAALQCLAACGASSGSVASGGGAPVGTPHSTLTLTPAPTVTTTPAATPTSTAAADGVVTVTTDRQRYGTTDTITVTVTNSHQYDIFAANHQTACTLVTLQRNDNGAWTPVPGCSASTVTALVPLRAGASDTFRLSPGGGRLKPAPWQVGTYRVVFTYTAKATSTAVGGAPAAGFSTISSASFTVS